MSQAISPTCHTTPRQRAAIPDSGCPAVQAGAPANCLPRLCAYPSQPAPFPVSKKETRCFLRGFPERDLMQWSSDLHGRFEEEGFERIETQVTSVSASGTHGAVMKYRSRNGFGGMTVGVARATYWNAGCWNLGCDYTISCVECGR